MGAEMDEIGMRHSGKLSDAAESVQDAMILQLNIRRPVDTTMEAFEALRIATGRGEADDFNRTI
jgi:hypothetical protein